MAVLEKRSADRLSELRTGIVVGAHAALLEDHLALGQERFVRQDEVRHAVGLVIHHQPEMLLGDGLVIDRVVRRGEGVLAAADIIDLGREFACRMGAGPLEHQVFEEVGDPRFSRLLVGRPGLVPDHVGDGRRAVVGNDDDLQAVPESEGADVGRNLVRGRGFGDKRQAGRDRRRSQRDGDPGQSRKVHECPF